MTAKVRVDPVSGRVLFDATDVVLHGPDPIAFTRRYDSSLTWQRSELGPGWHHALAPTRAMRDAVGRTLELRCSGRRVQLVATAGAMHAARTFVLDAEGRLVRVEDEHGVREEYEYDGALIVASRARGEAWRHYEYQGRDEWGFCCRTVVDGGLRDRRIVYHGATALVEDAAGGHRLYERDGRFRLTRIVERDGTARTFRFDAGGALLDESDEAGRTWSRGYDGDGALRSLCDPTGERCVIERTETSVEVWTPAAHARVDRDARGRPLVARAEGRSIAIDWRNGLPVGVRGDDGRSAALEYDGLGALRRISTDGIALGVVSDRTGTVTRLEREGTEWLTRTETRNGTEHTLRTASGATSILQHDPAGRLVRAVRPEGSLALLRDGAGQVVRIDLGPVSITVERDRAERVASLHDAARRLNIQRDRAGRIERVEDGEGRWIELRRDRHGHVARALTAGGDPVRVERDGCGRALFEADPPLRSVTPPRASLASALFGLLALIQLRSPLDAFEIPDLDADDVRRACAATGVALTHLDLALALEGDGGDGGDLLEVWLAGTGRSPAPVRSRTRTVRRLECPTRRLVSIHPFDQLAALRDVARALGA